MIDECNSSDYYNNRLKEPFGFFFIDCITAFRFSYPFIYSSCRMAREKNVSIPCFKLIIINALKAYLT